VLQNRREERVLKKQSNNYVVIMAGGIGSRFWPQSRVTKPKQFLDVLNTGKTLIQSTFDRYKTIVPSENIYVVTTTEYYGLVLEQLDFLNPENLILEPERKNTAPCIGYACYKIGKSNPKANILIAPSDHIILGEKKFEAIVENSFNFVDRKAALVTIGIKPNKPATGYGYIQYVEDDANLFKKVKTFTEKPNTDLAKTFLKSGDFLWNAGIFVWNVQTFMRSFEKNLPEMGELIQSVWEDLNTVKESVSMNNVYSQFSNISIDYGLMEKADEVYVIPADFEWSDLGSWSSIYDGLEKDYLGNATTSKLVKIYDASNNLIVAPQGKLVIIQGLEGKCIVDTKDALMILALDKEQDVKNFTTDIKRDKLDKFL
jgi:mannose-1-phosphate guanylyltransferase